MSLNHYNKFLALEEQIATQSQRVEVEMEEVEKASRAVCETVENIGVDSDSEKGAMDKMNVQLSAQSKQAAFQTKILIDCAKSVQNIAQHILTEHQLQYDNAAKMTEAMERIDTTYADASKVSDRQGSYLHLWGSGQAYNSN